MDISAILADFQRTLPLAGLDPQRIHLEVQDRGCPHVPAALPQAKMAVYVFVLADGVLKVGKVGPNSNARFQTQHYLPTSSKSNLAKSLLADASGPCSGVPPDDIGSWMQQRLRRIDILLNAAAGMSVLSYLEAFLHCRLSPRYEGFLSQR
jgi:hypothetical protein